MGGRTPKGGGLHPLMGTPPPSSHPLTSILFACFALFPVWFVADLTPQA